MESDKQIVQKAFEIMGVPSNLASQVAEILLKKDLEQVGCTPEEGRIINSALVWMNALPQKRMDSQHR
jgi:hypothetical protein